MGVEIVDRRDPAALVGEVESLVLATPDAENIAEDPVHGRAHTRVADLHEDVVAASKLALRAIEVASDHLGEPDVARVEALEQREVELLDQGTPDGGSTTGRLGVAEHRLEQSQDLERLRPECRVRVVGREELLAERDAVRCRHRAPPRRSKPRTHHLPEERSVTSLASELGASLEIDLAFAGAAELELARADLRTRGDQRRKVIRPLQRLGDLQGLRKLVLDGLLGIDTYAKRVVSQSRTGESRLFPDRSRKLDRRQKLRVGTFELTAAHEHPRELEHRLEVHPVVGAADVDRPLQETFGRGKVGATHCSHAGGEQPACRSRGELLVPHPELLSKDERLLEVVADDLVELEGGRVRSPLEPLRVALVELGPELLRHRPVRRVPDEQVPEPIRVLARDE